MSGFDVQMRSDAMTMPLRQRGAEMEGQAIAGIGGAAVDTVRWIHDAMREDEESSARLRLWETERQINLRKLQEMQAVDAAEAGRLQILQASQAVEAQRLQIDQARHDYEQKQRHSAMFTDAEMKDMKLAELQARFFGRDPYEAAEAGYVSKPGAGGVPLYRYDPEAAKPELERLAKMRRTSRAYSGMDHERSMALREIGMAQSEWRTALRDGDEDDIKAAKQRLDNLNAQYKEQYGHEPPALQAQEPQQPERAQPGAIGANVMAFENHPALKWNEDPRLRAFAPEGKPDRAVLDALSKMAEEVAAGAGYSPTEAQEYIATQVLRAPNLMTRLLWEAGYREEQIEMYLRAHFKLDDARIKAEIGAMRR